MRRVLALACLVAFTCACPAAPKSTGTPPAEYCPGGPGCEKGNDGHLFDAIGKLTTWEPAP
jgi:hypothetical protein